MCVLAKIKQYTTLKHFPPFLYLLLIPLFLAAPFVSNFSFPLNIQRHFELVGI
jgi:hypothetical protein